MKTPERERANRASPPDLIGAVIYELRQPFTSLRGQAQLARRLLASDPPQARRALDDVVAQVDRIDRLLDDALDRARASSRRTT